MNSAVIFCKAGHIEKGTMLTEELGFNVIKVFKKSYISDPTDQIWEIIHYVKENCIDVIVVDTCLTISSKIPEFLSIIHLLVEHDIALVTLDQNTEVINKGVINPQFKMVIDVLTEFDYDFQQKLSRRMGKAHLGYKLYMDAGGRVGRRTKKNSEYMDQYQEQIRLLRLGVSLKKCQQLTSTSINTLRKLKGMFT